MSYSIDTEQHIDRMIRFGRGNDVKFNFNDPKTFYDKLAWLNIYDTNELKVKCADKVQLHDYCVDKIGKDICVPMIAKYERVDDIDWNSLPDKFVIKCNHGAGMRIIVPDKTSADKSLIFHKLRIWMNTNFAFTNGFEAHYNDIHHMVVVEEYMDDGNDDLTNYRFWCFNGDPKFCSINGELGHGKMTCYRMNGTKWNLFGTNSDEYKKPANFAEMKKFAKVLAEPFKFVRINFYEINGQTYLGDMVFTPGACVVKCSSDEDDIKLGNMLKI